MLASTLALARSGAAVSLESAARAAGVTKPGLMYHFRTKEALMSAVVDHLMDQYERELVSRLPSASTAQLLAQRRLAAYVDWTFDGDFDAGDLVMFIDPRLRDTLVARWVERMEPWIAIPDDLPPTTRARLLSARLIADGIWFNSASSGATFSAQERTAVQTLAHQLIQENS